MTAKTRTVTEKDGENYSGVMVALVPPEGVAKDLALDQEDAETHKNLHITLAYLGNVDEYTPEQIKALSVLVRRWAKVQPPMRARIQGVGTFVPNGPGHPHVLWASVDVPGLHRVHADLVDLLKEKGYFLREDHSYTPHLTLAYRKHPWRFLPEVRSVTWPVDEVWVCVEGRWRSYPLGA